MTKHFFLKKHTFSKNEYPDQELSKTRISEALKKFTVSLRPIVSAIDFSTYILANYFTTLHD